MENGVPTIDAKADLIIWAGSVAAKVLCATFFSVSSMKVDLCSKVSRSCKFRCVWCFPIFSQISQRSALTFLSISSSVLEFLPLLPLIVSALF